MRSRISILSATLVVASGCHDGPTDPSRPLAADGVRGTALNASANDASTTSSVRWNRMSIALFRARGNPNAGRTSAYLSLAQYRAVLAAQDARHGKSRPSLAGAAAGRRLSCSRTPTRSTPLRSTRPSPRSGRNRR